MAQSKVNEYFVARKKSKGVQQSKRRRVEASETEDDISALKRSLRSSTTVTKDIESEIDTKTVSEIQPATTATKLRSKQKSQQRTTSVASSTGKRRGRSAKTVTIPENQLLITSTFSPQENIVFNDELTKNVAFNLESQCHTQEENTPKKQIHTNLEESETTAQPRRRKDKLIEESTATPETDNLQQKSRTRSRKVESARKQLQLPKETESNDIEDQKEITQVPSPITQMIEKDLLPKISPLPDTPVNLKQQEQKGPSLPSSPKVKAAMEKCKELLNDKDSLKPKSLEEKMEPENLRKQLRKCGKLEELKAQLLEMNKAIHKVKKAPKLKKFEDMKITSPVKEKKAPSISSEKATALPAYEKYHSLGTAAPTLNLPLKYQRLAETFRSMDTVVSMMHNRYEICTFSKLKNAVQIMMKKNFEKRHVGQIKTVHPAAYIFKQEKGLPEFGTRSTDYHLTIEANLEEDVKSSAEINEKKTKENHTQFSATHLMKRKNVFNNELINRVKYHHKNFLSNLDTPLSIPDEKITRWHPAFPLDQVPDIEEADLPQPPVVNKYHTAKDVLDARRGKLTAKVEEALENVAAMNIKKETVNNMVKEEPKVTVPDNAAYRGIPASLLEKIRAKEAKKLEQALTRDPEEEKKTLMMGRLPDMIRIIRTHFVTEKKPALPFEYVIKKLADSTKSNLSTTDVNNHLQLLLKVVPEWISMVEIKKGKYLKIGRNIDIHELCNKINGMVKARK